MANPFEMYDAEASPARIVEKDAIARGKAQLEAYKTLGDIAMQPDRAALLKAQAARANAQAEQEQMENDAARRLEAEIQQSDEYEDPIDQLYETAYRARKAGNVTASNQALEKAGQLMQRRAQAGRAYEAARRDQIEGQMRMGNTFANMLGGVKDQITLDAANDMYERMYGKPSPLKGRTYHPAEVQAFQDATLTKNQRLTEALRRAEEAGRNSARAETKRHNQVTEEDRDLDREARVAQAKRREKEGRGVARPTAGDLDAALDLIKQYQPDLTDYRERELASESIASRANQLLRDNRALTRVEAMQRAYDEEVAAGSFDRSEGVRVPFTDRKVGSKAKYVGMGRTPATARPMPARWREDRSLLKKDTYYATARGPLRWNGVDFDPPEPRGGGGGNGEDDGDDEVE